MKKNEYLTSSCSLPLVVRECLNSIFEEINKHILSHQSVRTMTVGKQALSIGQSSSSFSRLDFLVEDENGEECDYFEEDSINGNVFIKITCGCGEEFVVATSIFDNCGYEINAINYIEFVESFIEKINLMYNTKIVDKETEVKKSALYGLEP